MSSSSSHGMTGTLRPILTTPLHQLPKAVSMARRARRCPLGKGTNTTVRRGEAIRAARMVRETKATSEAAARQRRTIAQPGVVAETVTRLASRAKPQRTADPPVDFLPRLAVLWGGLAPPRPPKEKRKAPMCSARFKRPERSPYEATPTLLPSG
eukprot:Sspe_Gene.36994::Locus_17871_Transcript_1_1_Confidence_1.000_Length_480::g.36994::m.36994